MSYFKEHTTKDGVLTCTIPVWEDLLDSYTLDDLQEIYYDLFRKKTREALAPYMKRRMVNHKNK